ncbi:MAG: RnfABCDGE type electron transport complex subunit C [Planctomycetes bacterium]|nr:RnfABCDGE type electron transport complex subunit C [Planctomycetota bacterium]
MFLLTNDNASFAGGVHPPEGKHLTEDRAIEPGPSAKELALLLSQHIGAPAQPLVKKGEAVQAGQKIGDCQAFIGAPVHAPVAGKVRDIALQPHPVLGRSPAILIETQSDIPPTGPSFVRPPDFDPAAYPPEQICQAVREAGIVGMGGAGFPTSVKLQPDAKTPKETLIVNGCECEPYITCDYRVMLEWTDQVLTGIQLAQRACGASKVFFALEDNKPQAIEQVTASLQKLGLSSQITVVRVKTKYPQGGERQLIRAVLQKIVPTGGIPPAIGVVVSNVATVAALADAVVNGRPLTHRVVTVTGEGIARPGNYYVPIGTPVQALIDHCGGLEKDSARAVLGGPMMGLAVAALNTPSTKTRGRSDRPASRQDAPSDRMYPLWPLPAGLPGASEPDENRARRQEQSHGPGGEIPRHGLHRMRLLQLCLPVERRPDRLHQDGQDLSRSAKEENARVSVKEYG